MTATDLIARYSVDPLFILAALWLLAALTSAVSIDGGKR